MCPFRLNLSKREHFSKCVTTTFLLVPLNVNNERVLELHFHCLHQIHPVTLGIKPATFR